MVGGGGGWGGRVGPLGMGRVEVRMLHIMLCIMLHVLDHFATFPRPTRPTLIMKSSVLVFVPIRLYDRAPRGA